METLKTITVCPRAPRNAGSQYITYLGAAHETDKMTCAHCGAVPRGAPKHCDKCGGPVYCSKACQTVAWRAHKVVCRQVTQERRRGEIQRIMHALQYCYEADDIEGVIRMEDDVLAIADEMRSELSGAGASANIYFMMGNVYRQKGRVRRGLELHEKARTLVDQLERTDLEVKCAIYTSLAIDYSTVCRSDEALALHKAVFRMSTDAHSSSARSMCDIARCLLEKNQPADAVVWLGKAIAYARSKPGEKRSLCFGLGMLGCGHASMRRYTCAYTAYHEQWKLACKLELPDRKATSELGMGQARWAQARVDMAADAVGAALIDTEEAGAASAAAPRTHRLYAAAYWFAEAIKTTAVVGSPLYNNWQHREAELRAAFCASDAGDTEGALIHLEESLRLLHECAPGRCFFCKQIRDDGAPLLKCGNCRVMRFCDERCQMQASKKKGVENGSLCVRHSSICPLLRDKTRCTAIAPELREALMTAFLSNSARFLHL